MQVKCTVKGCDKTFEASEELIKMDKLIREIDPTYKGLSCPDCTPSCHDCDPDEDHGIQKH